MVRLLAWYLLERIVRIPAVFLMRLHDALMIKVLKITNPDILKNTERIEESKIEN